MRRAPVLLIALLTPALPWSAAAQTPTGLQLPLGSSPARFVQEKWSVDDGLPANQVTDTAQTPDGYLWLSTFDGLVRFDGSRFVVYNMGKSAGLPSNRIPTLDVSRSGDI